MLGVQMSGTSMASPHMTGVMALVKQTHPGLSSAELKSLVMSTAKTLVDTKKEVYPLSRQGAGRVQVLKAIDATVVTLPASLSLGEITIDSRKTMRRNLVVKNLSANAQTFDVALESNPALTMSGPTTLSLAAGESKTVSFSFVVDTANLKDTSTELDGMIRLMVGGAETSRIPVIGIANKVSNIEVESLVVHSTGATDAQGAAVDLALKNTSSHAGDVYLFNLLGEGARKEDPFHDPFMERGCNLQQAGYRVIDRNGVKVLQFAVKLFEPMTTWDNCEVSILIDSDHDGIPDQELVGAKQDHLKGLTKTEYASILLDAAKARALRKQFELDTLAKKENVAESYVSAVVDLNAMIAPNVSTIAIVEAPVSALALRGSGELAVRILTSYQELNAVQPDDYLVKDKSQWTSVNVGAEGAAFFGMPEKLSIAAGGSQTVSLSKGAGAENLLVLAPMNAPLFGGLARDRQSIVAQPTYGVDVAKAK
jgi:minor extracellular serine protease Vpr